MSVTIVFCKIRIGWCSKKNPFLQYNYLCSCGQFRHFTKYQKLEFPLFFRAADWKLDEPAWSGRMKITAKGKMAFIKLEDTNTGKWSVVSLELNWAKLVVFNKFN